MVEGGEYGWDGGNGWSSKSGLWQGGGYDIIFEMGGRFRNNGGGLYILHQLWDQRSIKLTNLNIFTSWGNYWLGKQKHKSHDTYILSSSQKYLFKRGRFNLR